MSDSLDLFGRKCDACHEFCLSTMEDIIRAEKEGIRFLCSECEEQEASR